MKRILEDLFYGNIRPNEKEFSQDSQYGEVARTVAEAERRLLSLLWERRLADCASKRTGSAVGSFISIHVLLDWCSHLCN